MIEISQRMRHDWNERACEDAHYYVAFGGRNQDEEAFLATAAEVVAAVEWEFRRFPVGANRRTWRAMEIGCGPGRLLRPLSKHFGEIHGVDVSDEMIRLAEERLRDVPHAHVHATDGASLRMFADESFDLVYSYAVFQHIPSQDVVREYMREIVRVLKPGGVFRGQFNSLPTNAMPDTWSGCSFTPREIRDFTFSHNLQLLALEGVFTQYMWTTWRKPPAALPNATAQPPMAIRRITNASSSETVVPNRGQMAALAIWVVNLPQECDLNTLDVRIDGNSADLVYVGPPETDGLQQVNVMLPARTRTGLVGVDLRYAGASLCPPAYVRVIPAGPLVPRVLSVTDGIHIIAQNRTKSGSLKIQLDEVEHPERVAAEVDGIPVRELEFFRTDPLPPRYEVNFLIPEGIGPGLHQLRIRVGKRALLPLEIEVAAPEDQPSSSGTPECDQKA